MHPEAGALLALEVAAASAPTDRGTASVSTSCIAVVQPVRAASSRQRSRGGERRQLRRVQDLVAVGIADARRWSVWSVRTVLIRPLLPLSIAARSLGPERRAASGPRRGDAGHLHRVVDEPHREPLLRARLGEVEAGCLPGSAEVHPQCDADPCLPVSAGHGASLSDQRSQPARDRCVIRCRSPACPDRGTYPS